MEITARKKSTDPIQEALRTHKDKWNLAAKEFINRMIAFKRGLNGRGDAHYSMPPGSIKDPLPDQVSTFLSTLSGNFEQLASEALKIEQEQANYSQNRKKPQENKSNPELPKAASLNKLASKNVAELQIGRHVVTTMLAITATEQEKGLMDKPWPPPVMSFIYSSPQINRFWMKNTPSPLDIVFALKGKVIAIHKGEPNSTTLIGNWEPSDLVVEFPFGSCAEMGIKIGDEIGLLKNITDLSNTLENKYSNNLK